MARTKTASTASEAVLQKDADFISGPDVHILVRAIGKVEIPPDTYTSDQVDEHLRTWLERGYRIEHVHVTHNQPGPSATGMIVDAVRWDCFFVLVKD